jgi:ABC-type transport system involved in multi-copper enzyme maturation permease subunit
VGGGLNRTFAVAANTFRETVRERVLYNLVFFAVVMTLAGILLRPLSIRQDEKILKDIGLASMDIFGVLIAVFIGTGLVSKEIERRSLYPLLAKPLSRGEFYLGKFAGLSFTLLVNLSVMLLGLLLTLGITGRGLDPSLLTAAYPIYLGLLLVVAFAMLFSSTTTSPALASVLTVVLVVVGRYADVIRGMRDVLPGVPQQLVRVMFALVPNFQNFDFKNQVAYGEAVRADVLGWVTAYAAVWILTVLGLGLASFRSRDFQ